MCGLLPVFCCSFFCYLEPSLHCVIQCGLLSPVATLCRR